MSAAKDKRIARLLRELADAFDAPTERPNARRARGLPKPPTAEEAAQNEGKLDEAAWQRYLRTHGTKRRIA